MILDHRGKGMLQFIRNSMSPPLSSLTCLLTHTPPLQSVSWVPVCSLLILKQESQSIYKCLRKWGGEGCKCFLELLRSVYLWLSENQELCNIERRGRGVGVKNPDQSQPGTHWVITWRKESAGQSELSFLKSERCLHCSTVLFLSLYYMSHMRS